MTASSEYAVWRRFDVANSFTADKPIDTGLVRDCLVNNALHMYDSSTQQLVNWSVPVGGSVLAPETPGTDFTPIVSFGPFPLRIKSDQTTTRIVVRLGVSTTSGTAEFLVGIVHRGSEPTRDSESPFIPQVGDGAQTFQTTSTTLTWTNPTTYVLYTTPADQPFEVTTDKTTSDTQQVQSSVPLYSLVIHGRQESGGGTPQLGAVYAREFVG